MSERKELLKARKFGMPSCFQRTFPPTGSFGQDPLDNLDLLILRFTFILVTESWKFFSINGIGELQRICGLT